jgi:tetraacyldisaccharide 4'-kinase
MSSPTEPWRRRGPFWTPFLAVLGALYRLGWACARLFQPRRPWRAGITVLSVGNLSVGGTGKSPLVRALAERALRRKKKPAILLRGYGAAPGPRPLLVSEGRGPRANAREAGDEAVEHARACACAVWVDADRVRAARAARGRGADCLILDDGFQRRRSLGRDLDLLLADFGQLAAGERLLPAGPWREPWSQAALADAVLVSGAPAGLKGKALRDGLPEAWRAAPVFRLDRAPQSLESWPDGKAVPLARLRKRAVLALSGLGRPEHFEALLRRLGARVHAWSFRDHHPFTAAELDAPPAKAGLIVTTAKDAVRLPLDWKPACPVLVLKVKAEVSPAPQFWRLVDAALKPKSSVEGPR